MLNFPYVHATNCAGCNQCCGKACPLDFLSPLSCGVSCVETLCAAPNQMWQAGDPLGLNADNRVVLWDGQVEFIGLAAKTVITNADGGVISERVLGTFAECPDCQVNFYVTGNFDEQSISIHNKQLLEDLISSGHVKRRYRYIVL